MADDDSQKLNVIRIKRKRGDEPINTLLVEAPVTKKSYVDAFQQLSTQDKEAPVQEPKLYCLVGTVTSHDSPTRLRDKIKEAQQKRKLLLTTSPKSPEVRTQETLENQQKQQKEARAKEIKLIRSSAKNEGFSDLFHLVDYVKANEPQPVKLEKLKDTNNNNNKNTTKNTTKDTLYCNYMPMVRQYLNAPKWESGVDESWLNDSRPIGHDKTEAMLLPDSEEEEEEEKAEEDDEEFVYDVYYSDATADPQAINATRVRIETYDEDLDLENEYDEDTDSDDEENRITDIYPDEDEDPEFEAAYGTDDDDSSEEGYDEDDDDNDSDEENYW